MKSAWLIAVLLALNSPLHAQDTVQVRPGAMVCGGWVVPDTTPGTVFRCQVNGPNDMRRVRAVVVVVVVDSVPAPPPPPPPPPVDTVKPPPPPPPPPSDTVSSGWREVFRDDFETGNLTLATGGYRWGGSSAGQGDGRPAVVTAAAHSGTKALRFTFAGNANLADDAWSEQRFVLGDTLKAVRLEWWIFLPPDFTIRNADGPDNNKFLRLWGGDETDGNNGYSRFRVKAGYSFQLGPQIIAESGTASRAVGPQGLTGWRGLPALGRWVPIAVEVTVATATTPGTMLLWVDGQLVSVNRENVAIYPTGGTGNWFRHGYLLGWANSGFTQTTTVYIDDFTVRVR
jgi:hypothetical protein